MFIKQFKQFVNEELVWGLDKISTATNNLLQLFSNDKLRIRQFLQSVMTTQKSRKPEFDKSTTKLKYLGGGGIGLTFEWIEPAQLQDDFEDDNFVGTQNYQTTDNLVIKITSKSGEAEKIIQTIQDGGKKPGLARYYWIKKFDLPDPSMQYSELLGPPSYFYDDKGIKKTRFEEHIKLRTQGVKFLADKRGKKISDEKAREKAKQRVEDDIKKSKQKGGNKTKNLWVICLERLDIPDKRQESILNLAIIYFYGTAKISAYPAAIITRNWINDKIINQFFDYLQNEQSSKWHGFELNAEDKQDFKKLNFSRQELKENILQVYNLYMQLSNLNPKSNKKLLQKLSLDLHTGNLGYDKSGNLVAFDMWV